MKLNLICPVCASEDFTVLVKDKLRTDTLKCGVCKLGIQSSIGSEFDSTDKILDFYSSKGYDSHQKSNNRPSAMERFNHDAWVAHQRFKQLENFIPKDWPDEASIWVDMGCSNSAFLTYAKRKGYKVIGLELDQERCKELSNTLLIPVYTPYNFFFSNLAYKYTDEMKYFLYSDRTVASLKVLSLFDVIEHLLDPVGFLLAHAKLFSRVVIETPDYSKSTSKNLKNWKHYRYNEHLTYWTKDSFEWLVNNGVLKNIFKICGVNYPIEDKLQIVLERI